MSEDYDRMVEKLKTVRDMKTQHASGENLSKSARQSPFGLS
ncbi:MAG: hypothetical protein OXC66_14185 [Roseovarius sp.]|nr:hypothetical protein [Roseovarius sp.]